MLRIVIVDDEVLIREGLARMIQKENIEFQITASRSDGQQVLDELDPNEIDVVITDIRMPQIGGLELIRELKESHPRVRTILMSGFTDFNYAREAIKYSAVEYLLKPINKDQLFELLYRLNDEKISAQLKEDRHRRGMLLSILLSRSSSPQLLPELVMPRPFFTLIAIKLSRSSDLQIQQNNQSIVVDQLELQERMQVLICYSDKELTDHELRVFCSSIISYVSSRPTLHMGISRSYPDLSSLYPAYQEAKKACDRGMYSDSYLYIANIQDQEAPQSGTLERLASSRAELIHELQILNLENVMKWIKNGLLSLRSEHAPPEAYLNYAQMIRETSANELQEFDLIYRSYTELEQYLLECMSYTELEHQFMNAFLSMFTEIRTKRMGMGANAVETVKQWISANYSQQADLHELAQMVFLTPSYLSKLFKQETGMTLTDYMIEVRIKRAKHLLRTEPGMKIHSIGAEVGYADPAYFNKLFKRIVGVTPNTYKQISRQSSGLISP
ncbi:response regulator [Paenibacillus sp. YPG26]|uniref:response regulator n=1 Tax=Paenibacillus sp. YPG26 TaxID=2878915 RepID=UPI00203BCA9C|nr:response regulator [Paenibacillus sp. YPG26]USB31789.1 response regulator [Paenibacillus sp. YPG26]